MMKKIAILLAVLSFYILPEGARGKDEAPYLKFCGANGTIFGSCHLLFTGKSTYLLDCGLFQEEGYPKAEVQRKNLFLAFEPRSIDAIFVTHSHADHIGKIPYLVKKGFTGKIYCTETTAEVAREMLRLYAWIFSKDSPIYDDNHVEMTIQHLVPCKLDRVYTLPDGLEFRFLEAGHILGSAMIDLDWQYEGENYSLAFTGDFGNPFSPLLRPAARLDEVDYLICESTYGNRLHNDFASDINRFRNIINDTVKKGGKVLIPAYILSRTQKILYFLNELIEGRSFDRSFDVYVDSRYANRITEIYRDNPELYDEETRAAMKIRDLPLSFRGLKEYKPRQPLTGPAVIIAPSGMVNVGNIQEHLKRYLPDPRSAVIFVGFQPEGMLGRMILDGTKWVYIHGEKIPVRASAHYLSSFSGHADYSQIIEWLNKFKRIGKIFVVHGQPDSSRDFARSIEAQTPFEAYVPRFLEKIYLSGSSESEDPEVTNPDQKIP